MKEVCEAFYLLMLIFIATPIFLGIVQMFSNAVRDDYAEKYELKHKKK